MTGYALAERLALADLFDEVGPDAPTLCDGWTTSDLAAHLVARERRPDSGLGILAKPFAGWTEKVRRGLRDKNDYRDLVDMVRDRPVWSPLANPLVDEAANTLEYFVHHEDVRRARPDWKPRELPADFETMLWRRLRAAAKLLLRGVTVPLTLVAPDYGERSIKSGPIPVRAVGAPGELILFCFGRHDAAKVTLDGPEDLVEALRSTPLGI